MKIDLLVGTGECPSAVIIPAGLLEPFKAMVRRGMAFESGQPQEMYEFADAVSAIPAPTYIGRSGSGKSIAGLNLED